MMRMLIANYVWLTQQKSASYAHFPKQLQLNGKKEVVWMREREDGDECRNNCVVGFRIVIRLMWVYLMQMFFFVEFNVIMTLVCKYFVCF